MRLLIYITLFLGLTCTARAENLTITVPALSGKTTLPTLYTCDDKDISPELTWTNAPKNTKSFVLTLSDPDAPSGIWYHWILYNIPKKITKIAENTSAGKTAVNSWGNTQYNGPCPPRGEKHRYIFTLYALDTLLNLKAGADDRAVNAAIKNHVLQQTQFISAYQRS